MMKILALLYLITTTSTFAITKVTQSKNHYSIGNKYISRTVTIEGKRLSTISIHNKWAELQIKPLASPEFSLRVSKGTEVVGTDDTLTSKDFAFISATTYELTTGKGMQFILKNEKYKLTVAVNYELKDNDFYMRKFLEITTTMPITIEQVDVDSLKLSDVYQNYQEKKVTAKAPWQWKPGLGQPLFTSETGLFLGVEFPASTNYVVDQTYTCGYQYGHVLKPGKTLKTYSSVMGVADDVKLVKDSFYRYVEEIRVRPLRLQVQYNSWFDFYSGVSKTSFAQSSEKINHELCELRGVTPLKAYVIDDGWQSSGGGSDWSKSGVWPVNGKFDKDFKSSLSTIHKLNSNLGLWLSPGCNFGARPAVHNMRKAGWGALRAYMSLANTPYMDDLERRMTELTKLGVTYFKLDGLFGHLNDREFDLDGLRNGVPVMPQLGTKGIEGADPRLNPAKYDEAKIYYLTVGAERLMKLFKHMAEVNPEVYIVISNGAWLSPWWLTSIDSVWMINAGDAAGGADRTGELVYRDSVYHDIWVKENTIFPMNALFNHEPKKVRSTETKETFRKYLYMNMSRGTGFIELYLKTPKLKDYDWDVLAEGLKWAEMVFPTFERSRMHGQDPKKGTYGYTAWNKAGGYVSIHNPTNKKVSYSFTLDRDFGLEPLAKNYFVSSPLAGSTTGLGKNYKYGESVTVSLEPKEIKILNFDDRKRDWSKLEALQTRTKVDYQAK